MAARTGTNPSGIHFPNNRNPAEILCAQVPFSPDLMNRIEWRKWQHGDDGGGCSSPNTRQTRRTCSGWPTSNAATSSSAGGSSENHCQLLWLPLKLTCTARDDWSLYYRHRHLRHGRIRVTYMQLPKSMALSSPYSFGRVYHSGDGQSFDVEGLFR